MGTSLRKTCPVCTRPSSGKFVDISWVPVNCSGLRLSPEEALLARRGDISLGFCDECGMIFNLAFDPSLLEYDETYDNALHFSGTFRTYAERLAQRLVDAYDLHDKDIVEIGCGDGQFLRLLCEIGNNRGVGFDPSIRGNPAVELTGRVRLIPDLYREEYARCPADFVCCRHVLEHLESPRALLHTLRRGLSTSPKAILYFEVPNTMSILRDRSIWDVIYPHASYFTELALLRLFNEAGFDVLGSGTSYGEQFLYIESVPNLRGRKFRHDNLAALERLATLVARFGDDFNDQVRSWSTYLERLSSSNQRVVLWGAGTKGVTFLNVVPAATCVQAVVDLNPRKQGKYVPGTGQPIISPADLARLQPDLVIVLNPLYREEVQACLEHMDLKPDIVVTAPESVRHETFAGVRAMPVG